MVVSDKSDQNMTSVKDNGGLDATSYIIIYIAAGAAGAIILLTVIIICILNCK